MWRLLQISVSKGFQGGKIFEKRESGKYKQTKIKQIKCLGPRCNGHQQPTTVKGGPRQDFKCDTINEDDLKSIHSLFWNLTSWERLHELSTLNKKLLLHKNSLGRREFHNLPNLPVSCSNDELFAYCEHLKNLHIDFTERYQDILNLEIPD